ncbi:MAG TPA: NEW3 domain-containing protein [Rhizobiaceae bacterium]|nr:NEW3 domain-containing protein [Rhizobiaceae bacterium]
MRPSHSILGAIALTSGIALATSGAFAQSAGTNAPTGIWLTTDFPAMTETAGNSFTVDVSLSNHGIPPKRIALALDGLPDGWTYEFDGDGKPIKAAMVGPGQTRDITVKITPAKGAAEKAYQLTLNGTGDGEKLSLPLDVTLAAPAPAALKLEAKLPALRGSAKSSFDYDLTVKNDSPQNVTVNLAARAPAGFETTFKEEYGSQELTSVPIKANQSKDLKLSVKPPQDVPAGQYKVLVGMNSGKAQAETPVVLDITGQPQLALVGPGGMLSGSAVAGKEHTFSFTVDNDGGAAAKDVALSANAPSGWKVDFEPTKLDQIPPGGKAKAEMRITPASNAIAGDYSVDVNADGQGASDDLKFRVTVETSTAWGFAGLGVIGVAVLVMAGAVTRYGRR